MDSQAKYQAISKIEGIRSIELEEVASASDEITEKDFEALGNFQGKPIKEVYESLIKRIDETSFANLIFKPQKEILDFKAFFAEKIPSKAFFTIQNSCPGVIPRIVPTVEPMIRLLVKMVSKSRLPEKLLAWIFSVVVPRQWSSSKDRTKCGILAASLCKMNEGKRVWAMLTDESHVILLEEQGDGSFEKSADVMAFRATTEDGEVRILDKDGQQIASFTPNDENSCQLWVSLFEAEKPNLFQFLTEKEYPRIPDEVLIAILNLFSENNMDEVRAILVPNVIPLQEISGVISNLITIGCYTQKITSINNAILTAIYEQPEATVENLIGEKSLLHPLYEAYVSKYGQKYFDAFGRKMVEYVDKKYNLSITESDPDKLERIIMTCLKYILGSIQFFPPELQHLASMISSYTNLKFNSKVAEFKILADFFANYVISPFLKTPTKFSNTIEVKNQKSLDCIADVMSVILTLTPISQEQFPQSEMITKRLERKYNDLIRTFIVETSIICYYVDGEIVRDAPTYDQPNIRELLGACEELTKTISIHSAQFSDVFGFMSNSKYFATSTIGWALSTIIMSFFREEDEDEAQKRTMDTAYLQELKEKMCVGPFESKEQKESFMIPEKRYKLVKKTSKMITKGVEKPDDKVVATSVLSEVIKPDGTKVTIIKKTVSRRKEKGDQPSPRSSETN